MFEQRFDHICFAHEEAMAAMQQRVRTVLAARGVAGGGRTDAAENEAARDGVGEADVSTTADSGSTGSGPARAAVGGASEVTTGASADAPAGAGGPGSAGGPGNGAPEQPESPAWPARVDRHAGAPLFDPRWNSDLR